MNYAIEDKEYAISANAIKEYFPSLKQSIREENSENVLLIVNRDNDWLIRSTKGSHRDRVTRKSSAVVLSPNLFLDKVITNVEVVRPRNESLESKFARHLEKFKSETMFLSNPDRITCNLNYLKIIALGSDAIPLILKEYFFKGGIWHNALVALTEANPVTENMFGKQKLIREAWKTWAVENGYL